MRAIAAIACIDGFQAYARLTRLAPATLHRLGLECMRERAKVAGQPLPDDYWRTLHAWATTIEESHYKPGVTEIRTSLLDAADALEKAGHSPWGSDIRQQISTFETSSKP